VSKKTHFGKHLALQGPKFIAVGGICSFLGLLFMWCATGLLEIHYLVATFLAFFVLNPIGFLLNRFFTFSAARGPWRTQIFRYHWAMLSSLVLNLAIVALLVDGLGLHYLAATVLSMFAMTVFNYIIHDVWSFRTR